MMLDMQMSEKRKRKRQKKRCLDIVNEDMQEVGATEGGVFD